MTLTPIFFPVFSVFSRFSGLFRFRWRLSGPGLSAIRFRIGLFWGDHGGSRSWLIPRQRLAPWLEVEIYHQIWWKSWDNDARKNGIPSWWKKLGTSLNFVDDDMFPKTENSPYFQGIFRSNPWQDGMDMGRFLEISGRGLVVAAWLGGVILSNIKIGDDQINGHSRILNWRYHYMVQYLQFRILEFPLIRIQEVGLQVLSNQDWTEWPTCLGFWRLR